MRIREFAKSRGFEVVGKLTRMVSERERYDPKTNSFKIEKEVYWLDEGGNSYLKGEKGFCICTADGGVI